VKAPEKSQPFQYGAPLMLLECALRRSGDQGARCTWANTSKRSTTYREQRRGRPSYPPIPCWRCSLEAGHTLWDRLLSMGRVLWGIWAWGTWHKYRCNVYSLLEYNVRRERVSCV